VTPHFSLHRSLDTSHSARGIRHPTSVSPTLSTVCVDDAELVERARGGDSAAFGELVDRHRSAVYRAALAVLRSHADAEDAAQDAFVAAYRHLRRFRGESAFRTWLLSIAWREAINRRRSLTAIWRRLVAWPHTDSDDDPMTEQPARERTPERIASDGELRREIRRAIAALTPTLRDTLLLAQSGEYTYAEIGAIVGAPIGTIKWRVAEARRAIRSALRNRGYTDAR
jgi:RNA polymerase sigma-70 factor, ECF subfamily